MPDELDEVLSPSWLTAALGERHSGIDVTGVVPGPVVSRVSTNARFSIECAGELPAGLSRDLCVKGYFGAMQVPAQERGHPRGRLLP